MLDHIFPEEYHRHLSRLLANTPRSSWEAVRRVIKQDLGDTPSSFAIPIPPYLPSLVLPSITSVTLSHEIHKPHYNTFSTHPPSNTSTYRKRARRSLFID